jgi:hypothetical protein
MYLVGRLLQIFALLMMPSAIWVADFQRSEAGALSIFLGSLGIFYVGYLFTRRGGAG